MKERELSIGGSGGTSWRRGSCNGYRKNGRMRACSGVCMEQQGPPRHRWVNYEWAFCRPGGSLDRSEVGLHKGALSSIF